MLGGQRQRQRAIGASTCWCSLDSVHRSQDEGWVAGQTAADVDSNRVRLKEP